MFISLQRCLFCVREEIGTIENYAVLFSFPAIFSYSFRLAHIFARLLLLIVHVRRDSASTCERHKIPADVIILHAHHKYFTFHSARTVASWWSNGSGSGYGDYNFFSLILFILMHLIICEQTKYTKMLCSLLLRLRLSHC